MAHVKILEKWPFLGSALGMVLCGCVILCFGAAVARGQAAFRGPASLNLPGDSDTQMQHRSSRTPAAVR